MWITIGKIIAFFNIATLLPLTFPKSKKPLRSANKTGRERKCVARITSQTINEVTGSPNTPSFQHFNGGEGHFIVQKQDVIPFFVPPPGMTTADITDVVVTYVSGWRE